MFLDLYLEKSLNLTRPLFSLEKSLSWGIEWNLLLSFTFYFNSQLVFQFHLSNLFSLSLHGHKTHLLYGPTIQILQIAYLFFSLFSAFKASPHELGQVMSRGALSQNPTMHSRRGNGPSSCGERGEITTTVGTCDECRIS
jgi:hypothetical protein